MSLFRIYVDGALFYHPNLSQLAITQAQVNEDAESMDSLTLSAPYNHPYIQSIQPMASTIVCKKGSTIVFEGRAVDDGTDFYNTHTWTCESCLAYLKDSLQPPFSYSGTLLGLLEYFIEQHNATVEEKKQFTVGTVTVTDDNDYISYSNSDYSVTLDAIRNKLLDTHGGYLRVRFEDDIRYLDYLSDFTTKTLQTVEYGKNLTDVEITRDHTERITALIPLGAYATETDEETGEETETDSRIDITTVNDGKNYIYDAEAVEEIGWIWAVEIWEDVTLPTNLLRKAQARLAELSAGITSMELSIVDEADAGVDTGAIHARSYVYCYSQPHGIDGTYLCLSKTVDYLNPANNTITIGASGVKLTAATAKQNQTISALEDDLLGQTSKIATAVAAADAASQAATEAQELASGFQDDISALQVNVYECYSEITKTASEIQSAVSETYATKSDLETIQTDFETRITQTSTEIRMDFTSVTDSIKDNVAENQELLEQYIRFSGALIELGMVGNSFTTELSNESLAFLQDGAVIAYISNNTLNITNAEVRSRMSIGSDDMGWFDFLPRTSGNLSIVWRDVSTSD